MRRKYIGRHRAAPEGKDIDGDGHTNLEPLLYTVDETAVLLHVSVRTIRNLLRRGELKRLKIGSLTRIPVVSVEVFLRRDHATR